MVHATTNNGTGITVARKARRQPPAPKPAKPNLFHLWHSIQDLKQDAERMKDKELVFLIGLVELLVEERTSQGGAALAAADTTRPN